MYASHQPRAAIARGLLLISLSIAGARAPVAHAACPTLGVPTGLSAEQGTSCGAIAVTWNFVPGATGYDLVRVRPNGVSETVVTNWAATSYFDGVPFELLNGVNVQYKVAAHYLNGTDNCQGSFSSLVTGRTKKFPVAPATLTASAPGGTIVRLTWSAVPDAGIYNIYRYELTSGPRTLLASNLPATQLSFDYNEQICGTHRYAVTSNNICGPESPEKTVDFLAPITPTGNVPTAPPLSTPAAGATVCTPTTALTWGVGCLATGYRVQLSAASTFATLLLDQATSATNRTATTPTLSQSTTYYWRVQSTNGPNVSAWTTASFTTGKKPVIPMLQSPWVVRNFLGPVYRNETGKVWVYPDAGGCACNFAWTFYGGGPYNYATYWSGNYGQAYNIGVSQIVTLGYTITPSNAFGAGASVNLGWSLQPGTRPPGGCPYVAPWNGAEFVDENNLLPTAERPENRGRIVSDYYQLQNPLVADAGTYRLKIREFEQESSRFEDLRLLFVDHPIGTDVAVDASGRVTLFAPLGEAGMTSDGSAGRSVVRGERIALDPAEGAGGASMATGVILRGSVPFKPPITGGLIAEAGENTAPFTFRERVSRAFVPLPAGARRELRLQFEHDATLDGATFVRVLDASPALVEAPLVQAFHDGPRGSRPLAARGGDDWTLSPGEDIELRFAEPPLKAGMARSFVIHARGTYEKQPAANGPASTVTRAFLSATRVNGGADEATFSFGLPSAGRVSLTVHDLQGREVARVIDGEQLAGEHDVRWSTRALPRGVYFAQLRAAGGGTLLGRAKVVLLPR